MRNLIFVIVLATTAVPFALLSQQRKAPAGVGTEEQRVLAVEDEYVAAEVGRDEAALQRLVDDRFVQSTSTYVKRQGQWRMLALQMQPRSTQ